ncbi:tripartite tricarboxylate transporter substrate binding protein [Roseomonas populi]|uniref:Tripartite tricarboxylate transporter substrate binding protein n=1 Tax=Roseomonas populi TaxID=3121582 RepID=A0ABT1XA68_9PROT|nr:tripartite tricarboxylate transporter substrate binding protein [Roseomonas pecuniae]MCR0985000.1 tripartite tricarboxylate transporter substrate binding protein [Roseomonas pecuniae]
MIVAPGGSADSLARILAERLSATLQQTVIVENRPGGGGNVASTYVAQSPGDGYTLLVTANNHTLNPALFRNAGYTLDDLAPVAEMMRGPSLIATSVSSPYQSLGDLLSAARTTPGAVSFGSAGVGTPSHVAGELLAKAAGVRLNHVPYRGSGPSLNDAIGGQLPVVITSLVAAMPHVQSGRMRALAVTSAERWPSAPDVPAAAEFGLPGYAHMTWLGLFAPRGTPGTVLSKLNAEVNAALAAPDVRRRVALLGGDVGQTGTEEFARILAEDHRVNARLVDELGLRVE